MDFSTLADEIAAVSHRVWCQQMIQEGWRVGRADDAVDKVHHALRPCAELSSLDRTRLRYVTTYEQCAEHLLSCSREAMMGSWPVIPGLRVGLRVRAVHGEPAGIGTVISFTLTVMEPEIIDDVVVQWPNGEVLTYCPNEGDLAPAE